jgi:hypothetical protein
MPIMMMNRYTREIIKNNPHTLFVFGDNNSRIGTGGQAGEARNLLNAIGVRTKKAPTYNDVDFLTDKEYHQNIKWILEDLEPVFKALSENKIVVWPSDGIGTGLAKLHVHAPETLRFIGCVLESLQHIYRTEN